MKHVLISAAIMLVPGAGISAKPPFPPAKNFEIVKYLGKWYEIARMPNSFEKGLIRVTAEYSPGPDGKVKVVNSGSKNGERKSITGKAKFAGPSNIGHLKVSFFWIFYSDYIVAEIDEDYTYALVAGGSNKYLWILSRTQTLPQETIDKLIERAHALGFDTAKLYFVPQH